MIFIAMAELSLAFYAQAINQDKEGQLIFDDCYFDGRYFRYQTKDYALDYVPGTFILLMTVI